ncbi:hypothetical protein [Echinicola salinicaeni]|uniref:hypothetical protein n=1 Tax=Echinicola salinicaeni TaxID=2762757 RepID=UPI001645197A|nr:hypothetical protein [Echinicola salinicaeni]
MAIFKAATEVLSTDMLMLKDQPINFLSVRSITVVRYSHPFPVQLPSRFFQ